MTVFSLTSIEDDAGETVTKPPDEAPLLKKDVNFRVMSKAQKSVNSLSTVEGVTPSLASLSIQKPGNFGMNNCKSSDSHLDVLSEDHEVCNPVLTKCDKSTNSTFQPSMHYKSGDLIHTLEESTDEAETHPVKRKKGVRLSVKKQRASVKKQRATISSEENCSVHDDNELTPRTHASVASDDKIGDHLLSPRVPRSSRVSSGSDESGNCQLPICRRESKRSTLPHNIAAKKLPTDYCVGEGILKSCYEGILNAASLFLGPRSCSLTTYKDRFVYKQSTALLGEGSFTRVIKAKDLQNKGTRVALKRYDNVYEHQHCGGAWCAMFKRHVEVLQAMQDDNIIPNWISVGNLPPSVLESLDPKKACMKLMYFSQDSFGKPSSDPDGNCYLFTSLGCKTLQEVINKRRKDVKLQQTLKGGSHRGSSIYDKAFQSEIPGGIGPHLFSIPEVRHVMYQLIAGVACLHAKGYVHMDLKPENIMIDSEGQIRIIDLDGAKKINSRYYFEKQMDDDASFSSSITTNDAYHGDHIKSNDIGSNGIIYTTIYSAPEVCQIPIFEDALNSNSHIGKKIPKYLIIRPEMDTWSIGMIAMELILGENIYQELHDRLWKRYGCVVTVERSLVSSMCVKRSFPNSKKVMAFNESLAKLIAKDLCAVDVNDRANLVDCLTHPFFKNDEVRYSHQLSQAFCKKMSQSV